MNEGEDEEERGPKISLEEFQRRQQQYQTDAQFKEEKDGYLKAILSRFAIVGERRLHMTLETYWFVVFLAIFLCYIAITKTNGDVVDMIEGMRTIEYKLAAAPLGSQELEATSKRMRLRNVESIADYWRWVELVLFPIICTENKNALGTLCIDGCCGRINMYNRVLYAVRFRQIRMKAKQCTVAVGSLLDFHKYIYPCPETYSEDDEETNLYQGQPWRSAAELKNDVFGSDALTRVPAVGSAFPGSGYVYDWAINTTSRAAMQQQLTQLQEQHWLDEFTRLATAEFTVYNAQTGTYLYISVACRQSAEGNVLCKPSYMPFKILKYSLSDPISLLIIILEVLILFYTVLFTVQQIMQLFHPNLQAYLNPVDPNAATGPGVTSSKDASPWYRRPWNYLKKFKDPFEVIHVANILFFIVFYYVQAGWYFNSAIQDWELQNALTSYQNTHPIAVHTAAVQSWAALNCVFTFLRLLKYTQLSTTLSILLLTIYRSSRALGGFCIILALIFVGYTFMAMVAFGDHLSVFARIITAFSGVFLFLQGEYCLDCYEHTNPFIAYVFFYSFVIIVSMILLNVFIAILQENYADVFDTLNHLESPPPVISWTRLLLGAWAEKCLNKTKDKVYAHAYKVDEGVVSKGKDSAQKPATENLEDDDESSTQSEKLETSPLNAGKEFATQAASKVSEVSDSGKEFATQAASKVSEVSDSGKEFATQAASKVSDSGKEFATQAASGQRTSQYTS